MVFSSVPVYLDQPWQQQQLNHEHHHLSQQSSGRTSTDHNPNPPPPPPPPPPQPPTSGSSGGGAVKPGSMAERARLAKIPQPETALKCPRCDSTNTKFCYFNNYSLTQPRHFCKTCRRYWTRGGALRTVPVGGGCRRNKRSSKSSSGKSKPSSSTSAGTVTASAAATSGGGGGGSGGGSDMFGHMPPPPPPHFPYLPNLHHLGGSNDHQHYGGGGDLGLNFSGGSDVDFLAEQWRLQQQVNHFPFLGGGGGLDPPMSGSAMLYPSSSFGHPKLMDSSGLASQMSAVKVEGNVGNSSNQGLNMSRNFLGVLGSTNSSYDQPQSHHHYNLGANTSNNSNAWTTDLSSFSTSSSTNHNLI